MNKYQWNLEAILGNETYETLKKHYLKQLVALANAKATFLNSQKEFELYNNLCLKVALTSNKINNYLNNKISQNLNDKINLGRRQELDFLSQKYDLIFSDIDNLIIKNQAKIQKFLKKPSAAKFSKSYSEVFKLKPHILSNKLEKHETKKRLLSNSYSEIFSTLLHSDLKVIPAYNSKNKKVKIETEVDYFKTQKSSDRILRKNAWVNFNQAIYHHKDTLLLNITYFYLEMNALVKVRQYDNYIASCLKDDEINFLILEKIYSNVKKFNQAYKKFWNLKKQVLKKQWSLSKIEPWDLGVEIIKSKVVYSPQKCEQEILSVLQIMGSEYQNYVKKIFNENWIDWMPKKNRDPGAYCIDNSKGLDKVYILFNFDKTINSVYTLIHELGHALHAIYTNNNQEIYYNPELFYSEIPSILNEQLLSYHLITKYANNKSVLLFIYDQMISNFFDTSLHQILYSVFESNINNHLLKTGKITYLDYQEITEKLEREYMNVSLAKIKKYRKGIYKYASTSYLTVPHFYIGNFYVYKYAIGQVCAMYLAKKIYNDDKQVLLQYFNFLKSGNSLNNLETLQILGINIADDYIWDEALKEVTNWIQKYQMLIKST